MHTTRHVVFGKGNTEFRYLSCRPDKIRRSLFISNINSSIFCFCYKTKKLRSLFFNFLDKMGNIRLLPAGCWAALPCAVGHHFYYIITEILIVCTGIYLNLFTSYVVERSDELVNSAHVV